MLPLLRQTLAAVDLTSVFPIAGQIRSYRRSTLRADLIAGATVAVVSLPQAIGFALIAGLPPQMVVASLLVGGLTAALFTSSHHTVFGPTNTISIFLAGIIYARASDVLTPSQVAVLVGFTMGVVQLAAGLARVGNLTQFISRSVIIGYTTGIAFLIAIGQLANLFGSETRRGANLIQSLWHTFVNVFSGDANFYAAGLGIASLLAMILIHRHRPRWPEGLIVLAAASVIVAVLDLRTEGVRTVGDIGALIPGLPHFTGSPVSVESLADVSNFLNAALALAILGMLEGVSIAKNTAAKTGQRINANQELVGMGAGNLAASLFGAMPGSASFVRSAVNYQAGGRTQFSSIFSSLIIGLALLTIVPLANRLPTSCLAAVLILVAYRMINRDQIRLACNSTRSDAIVFFVTLAGALLLKLDTAIYLGVATSLGLFLRKASTPQLVEYGFNPAGSLSELDASAQRNNSAISIIHVEGDLFFGAADLFQDQIRRLADEQDIKVFILRMKNARHLDATTVMALDQLLDYLRPSGRHLLISGIHGDVARVLKSSGLLKKIGIENVFPAEANLTMATKRALLRASQLLQASGTKAQVRIFYDRERQPAASTAETEEPTEKPPPLYDI